MTRKQWINNLKTEDALKINSVFHAITIGTKPVKSGLEEEYNQRTRTGVRNFLRRTKLTQRHIKIQSGRLAAGLSVLPINKLVAL